jgi:DNA polymerase elongation subunit (family B)
MNKLLYGHSTDERIVAVYPVDDSTMRLCLREGGKIISRDEKFFPFIFLSDDSFLQGFTRRHWSKRLDGPLHYQHLCVFEEWSTMWDAVRAVLEFYNRTALTKIETYADCEALYLIPDPVTQFLMQSGRTLFKGMTFDDVHRLQLDIETYTAAPHRFSRASRPTDRIVLVALADNRGWEHVIDGHRMSEKQMLQELVRLIRERDPDVIEGHNIYGFDLPYILKRSEYHDVPFAVGRDGSLPRVFETRTSFGEYPLEYPVTEIHGRHVIDTLLLVQSYDAVKKSMESYGLKYAAQHFGFASPDRVYVPGDRISWYWENEPATLVKYALDDVRETRTLSEHLSVTSFYLTSMLPGNYGHVARMGSAAKIESLLVREYLRQRHSLPKPQQGAQTSGGYTDVFLVGVVGPVVHADVESLYPSVMISNGIAPASDPLRVFPSLLGELTAQRLSAKRAAKAASDPIEQSRLDAMQGSLKILVNSFYGYLGYSKALFNDYTAADTVTQTGQQILKRMIDYIQTGGGKVIEVDTDGIFFVPPEDVKTEDNELAFVKGLSDAMPRGITVAHDGRYRKMLSYKRKNYALLSYDKRIRIKGSSLVSRSMEKFGLTFIHQCVDFLLNGNVDSLHHLYQEYRQLILERKLDVRDFARVETLKDTLDQYTDLVTEGRRNRSAPYEVALASGRPYRPGEKVAYYITGNDPGVRGFEHCKSADDWDPNFPDENTAFYLKRLDEFAAKFADFFQPQDFHAVFSADDLFPFDGKKIIPVIFTPSTGAPEPLDEPRPFKFGIWLDE